MAARAIYRLELLWHLVWFSKSALVFVAAALTALFARRGLLHGTRRRKTAFRIIEGVIATLVLSVPLRMFLPMCLLPGGIDQHTFVPPYVAAVAVVPWVNWSEVRAVKSRTGGRL